jgi:autotransporter-associated beta strand protein
LLVDGSVAGSPTSLTVTEVGQYLGARPLNFATETSSGTLSGGTQGVQVLAGTANKWIFGGTLIQAAASTGSLLATTPVNSLIFGGSSMSLGGTLTIDLNRALNLESGGVLATASSSIEPGTAGAGALNTVSNAAFYFHTPGAGTVLSVNVPLGGVLAPTSGGLAKSGEGTLVLNGANNFYTGLTALNLGTLQFGLGAASLNPEFYPFTTPPAGAIIAGTSTTSDWLSNPGSTLDLQGKSQTVRSIYSAGVATARPRHP